MRDPGDWDEKYLLSLPVGEFDWLEVKGRKAIDLTLPGVDERACRDNLSKALSAFANSGGGTLVFGLRNPTASWQIDDGGVPLSGLKGRSSTREWLEDIIPESVDMPLVGFNVYVVTKDSVDSGIAEGRGIFIIDIRDSEQAPHQANDNKYYARVGGKSRPINHKLVTDIFNRRRHPKMKLGAEFQISSRKKANISHLIGEPSLGYAPTISGDSPPEEEVIKIVFEARNIGRILVNYMQCFVWLPKVFFLGFPYSELELETKRIDDTEYVRLKADNTERDVTGPGPIGEISLPEYGPSWYKRILPGLGISWSYEFSRKARSWMLREYFNNYVYWEIYADSAPVEKDRIMIGNINILNK